MNVNEQQDEKTIARWELFAVLGATLIGFCLRLYQLGDIPQGLWMDEGLMGQGVLGILDGSAWPILFYNSGLPEEPISYYLSAISVYLFGQNTFAMRLPNALFGTLSIPLVWLTARLFIGPKAAVIAALYFATFRWHVHFSRLGFRTLLAPFFTLLIFWAFAKFWQQKRLLWACFAGVFLGASLYTYTGMRTMVLGILVWFSVGVIIETIRLRRTTTPALNAEAKPADQLMPLKGLMAAVGFALLVFAPLGGHFLYNPEHFSSRQNDVTLFNEDGFQWELFRRHVRDVALMGAFRGDDEIKHNLPGSPSFVQSYLWHTNADTEFEQWQALKQAGLPPDGAFTPDGRFDPNGFGHPVFDLLTGALFYLGLILTMIKALRGSAMHWGLLIWLFAGSANSIFSQGAPNQLRMLMVAPLACMMVGQALDWLLRALPMWKNPLRDVLVLTLLWGWFSAGETYRYFHEWAPHPDVGRAFNRDFTEVAQWLQENAPNDQPVIGPEFFVKFTSVDFLTRGIVSIKSDVEFADSTKGDRPKSGTWLLITNTQYFPPLQLEVPESTPLNLVKEFSHEGKFTWVAVYELQ